MKKNHFVYIYKDLSDKIHYVGYGKNTERAISHQSKTHNKPLEQLIKDKKYTVHIAGPYESELIARTVEAALISALNPLCNKRQEKNEWRFRPIGIDSSLADRPSLNSLQKSDFLKNHHSVIFVKISDINFSDRKGYDISSPPTDIEIIERVVKYWQLGKHLAEWIAHPDESPSLLVGVTGRPGSQMVIAALEVDRSKWKDVEIRKNGIIEIPVKSSSIDTNQLRGRRIDLSAGVRFGAVKSKFFHIINVNQ